MQITEKLELPFQPEINRLAEIQVLQSENFGLSLQQQFALFTEEYQRTVDDYYANKQLELIKKTELVDFMFDLHMKSFNLPIEFEQTFQLLKIITAKSALYHSAFFTHAHNPVTHYLRTASSHIKQKLHYKNKKECLKLLSDNIQLLIIKYQSDPTFFHIQSKAVINLFKVTKAKNSVNKKHTQALKTTYLKDSFTREISHISDKASDKKMNVFLFSAKNLKKGDWVNLKKASKSALIKLIWKANDNSEFIFVNMDGEKVRQCTLIELASDFENGVIALISDNPSSFKKNNSVLKTIG